MLSTGYNRPFPSSKNSHFQSEAKWSLRCRRYLTPVSNILEATLISFFWSPRLQNSRFFLKIGKEIGKAWRKSPTRAIGRECLSPVSLSVFSLVPDLLFDYSRVLEYEKIRTVLQSTWSPTDLKSYRKYVSSFFSTWLVNRQWQFSG